MIRKIKPVFDWIMTTPGAELRIQHVEERDSIRVKVIAPDGAAFTAINPVELKIKESLEYPDAALELVVDTILELHQSATTIRKDT